MRHAAFKTITCVYRFVEDSARNNLFLDDEGNAFDLVARNIQVHVTFLSSFIIIFIKILFILSLKISIKLIIKRPVVII